MKITKYRSGIFLCGMLWCRDVVKCHSVSPSPLCSSLSPSPLCSSRSPSPLILKSVSSNHVQVLTPRAQVHVHWSKVQVQVLKTALESTSWTRVLQLCGGTVFCCTYVTDSETLGGYGEYEYQNFAPLIDWLIDWLIVCLTARQQSKQKNQFVPTVEEGNWLRRQRIANEIQCTIPYVTR